MSLFLLAHIAAPPSTQAAYGNMFQLGATILLGGYCVYVFTVLGFLKFHNQYGFADREDPGCKDLLDCLLSHIGASSVP